MSEGPAHRFPPPGSPPPEDPAAPAPPEASYDVAAYPPPGAPPPGTHPQPAAPAYQGMLGAAHKPGAIPLRPLGLGAIYDGAFRIIRFNPKATVGAAVLVTAVANLIPVVLTAVLSLTLGISFESSMDPDTGAASAEVSTGEVLGLLGIVLSLLVGSLATWFGLVFVTGMVAVVTQAAATGKRLGLAEAWAATAGRRWRLVGLNCVISLGALVATMLYVAAWVAIVVLVDDWVPIVLFGVITVPAFVCAMCWYWIRLYYLPVPALMLERVGVFAAIGRGYRLTARQFWRTFGIALLTWLIVTFAGSILTTPISLIGNLAAVAVPDAGWLVLVASSALASVVQYAFVAPFTAAVTSLQYLDQRMRKEGYDVELMREAGVR